MLIFVWRLEITVAAAQLFLNENILCYGRSKEPEERKAHYIQQIQGMCTDGVDVGNLLESVGAVDFITLQRGDLSFFDAYRSACI